MQPRQYLRSDVVVRRRAARRRRGRLRLVVGLVPRREHPHRAELLAERLEGAPVGGGRGRTAARGPRVAVVRPAAARGGEGDERLAAGGVDAAEEARDLPPLAGLLGVVPRDEVAHALDAVAAKR